jgi:OmpA-OmpF porin, OOP family
MKVRTSLLIMCGILILCANNVYAEIQPGSFSVSPNVGYYFFDRTQDFKNSLTYGGGLGYDFTKHFGVEGLYNVLDAKTKSTDADVDGYLARIEGLIYFGSDKNFVPYIAVGAGSINVKHPVNKLDKNFGEFGFGLKYFLSDKIALRADFRDIMVPSKFNPLFTIGLTFHFGGSKKVEAVEERPAPQPVQVRDSDGDGVTDDMDKCPNTPAGVKVDSVGCPLDSDMDGVPDYLDKCPNTPAGVKVDSMGCPLDSDKDGVPDNLDKCPNTPAGVKVDSTGCPLDSDKDGVPDYLDKCPGTPAGVKVDSVGCPLDSDGDGVVDTNDQCPDTPKGATVDQRGCWIIKDLQFDTAKANIKPEYTKLLDDVVTVLKENPMLKIEIQGHTDNVGKETYNEKLSMKRAQAVMEFLEKSGIDKGRLTAKGYGFSKPAASNDTPEGRAENRRVELTPVQ